MIFLMSRLKRRLVNNIINIPGWRTSRHIIVFESDDWGSIRMPSRDIFRLCLNHGYSVDKELFTKFDSLASEEDLTLLFDLLLSFKDSKFNHPVITANCLTSNPDFEKIRESDFKEYHSEPITETLMKYPQHAHCMDIWKEGIRLNIFKPQSHGREHLNVSRFMNDLRSGDKDAHFAFNYQMPGIFRKDAVELGNDYIVSLEHSDSKDKEEKEGIIEEGLVRFKSLFSYPSLSFIPSNYVWHPDLEARLDRMGVQFIQGSKFQYIPKGNYSGFRSKYHYLGQVNTLGQIYLTRNVFFEPTLDVSTDIVDAVLKQIETAFRWNKPAIISTHRINYVGFIDPKNRDRTLALFNSLLKRITQKWNDVEFMSTDELGKLIKHGKKNTTE